MRDLIHHLSDYWLEGTIRAYDGLRRGWSEVFPVQEDPPATTPFEVVAEHGKLRLRYYRAQGNPQPTPLLLVYALIKRPFILDFQPERSVVETLTRQGFTVYLTDWIPPTSDDTWRGFDAYVNHDLAQTVQFICKREGTDQVSLLGYCLGGLLGTMYTALYPDTVKQYIALALPLDMSVRDIPMSALVDALTPETVALITKTYGNCPAWIIHADFTAMAPVHHALGKYVDLYRQRAREGYAATFDLFERWMHSDVPLAGRLFQELSDDIFRHNRLVLGQLDVGGRAVNLRHIRCPVLNIIGEHDDVVHPNSSLPLFDLVGSQEKQNLVFSAGHMGLAVSSAAHKNLWPKVGHWLKERDDNRTQQLNTYKERKSTMTTTTTFIPLVGSDRDALPGARKVGLADPDERVFVTMLVRRRPTVKPLKAMIEETSGRTSRQRWRLNHHDFAAQYGADPQDLEQVEDFAHVHGLDVVEVQPSQRRVVLSGTVAALSAAFHVQLARYEHPQGTYRHKR